LAGKHDISAELAHSIIVTEQWLALPWKWRQQAPLKCS